MTAVARPLSRRDRIRLFPPVHAFWYATRWLGLRDRLRCPECGAVGTWKPHGTLTARWGKDKDRPVRRWLCKWCGHYVGPEGVIHAWPDSARKVWALPRPYDPESTPEPEETPADVLRRELGKAWPWRG